ncbi:MAG: septal ring lytic transglycosylase RlpA family protein [Sphingomonadaceae bacterium]
MRLLNNVSRIALASGCAAFLTGCGVSGGGDARYVANAPAVDNSADETMPYGPAADYPMVLGDPYSVDGALYTPADTMSYDAVGYATLDRQAEGGVTAAHKTLPLPSYVEVTELESGKTILVRVERRGPMTGKREIALSPAAAAQLNIAEGGAVRVRRVNPPEADRAELRSSKAVTPRMDTPKTLLTVLSRKLPAQGSAMLHSSAPQPARSGGPAIAKPAQAVDGGTKQEVTVQTPPRIVHKPGAPAASSGYALAPLSELAGKAPARTESRQTQQSPQNREQHSATGSGFIVQAAAFSSKASADRVARSLGGNVTRAGQYYRVRTGPYASRGQADAALAKVKAAGYSDARILTAG